MKAALDRFPWFPDADRLRPALPWVLAMASGGAMAAPYLHDEAGWLGWVALVPLVALVVPSPGGGAGHPSPPALGFAWGLVFWGATVSWVWHTSVFGMVALVAYLALYPAAWAWALARLARGWPRPSGGHHLALAALGAAAWVALEAVRGRMLGGFPWNDLAVSQSRNLALIQVAEWTGAAGLSFVVAFFNLALWLAWRRLRAERFSMRSWRYEFSVALALVAACLMVGMRQVLAAAADRGLPRRGLRLALVQPNIPQEVKFEAMSQEKQRETFRRLTLLAAATKPDAVVWPETALVDGPSWDARSRRWLAQLAFESGTAILLGTVDADAGPAGRAPRYFNAAVIMSSSGRLSPAYRKLHLVPFGEYIPLEKWIPWMKYLTPIPGSFGEGEKAMLLEVAGVRLGPLICFEDTMPGLSRDLVKMGADVLLNLTNDAWFKQSPGAAIHLRNAVLRAVETRRPLVRCTNHGFTAMVSPLGQVSARAAPFCEGLLSVTVPAGEGLTFYTRHGDWLAVLCVAAASTGLLAAWRRDAPAA